MAISKCELRKHLPTCCFGQENPPADWVSQAQSLPSTVRYKGVSNEAMKPMHCFHFLAAMEKRP